MRLKTERLLIRNDTVEDADAVAALWSDPDVMRYMWGPRDPERVRQAVIDSAQGGDEDIAIWSVEEHASSEFVGDCGLIRKEIAGRDEVELVYLVVRRHWGRGIATEAASAVRDYAFRDLDFDRFVAMVHPENTASCRVAEKIGMAYDGMVERPKAAMRLYVATRRRGADQ